MNMRTKFHHDIGKTNYHGTQRKGEPWNKETVKGWKLRFIDIKKSLGERTRSRLYWRFILYRPSGACHYFDFALVPAE